MTSWILSGFRNMAISLIHGHPLRYIGLSTDEKPTERSRVQLGTEFIESDTKAVYIFNGKEWIVKTEGFQPNQMHLWNVENWEWEAATKGSGTGQAVSVENFPAVISGASIPVTGTISGDDPTTKYKITDIDPTEGNSYFGYVDKDGAWFIMNLTATAARYFKGNDHYTDAWNTKGDLDYGYFHNVF
jgi:hypothetical protein